MQSSLIDVSKAYEYINQIKQNNGSNGKQLNSEDRNDYNPTYVTNKASNMDSIDIVPSNQIVKRQSQGQKWSRILEYMRRNPKALMEAIPSPRPEDKLKDFQIPSFNALKEHLNNLSGPSMPAVGGLAGFHRMKTDSDGGHSCASSHFSKNTNKSKRRKSDRNSTRMVVMKPVPISQANGSASKKFRLEGMHIL